MIGTAGTAVHLQIPELARWRVCFARHLVIPCIFYLTIIDVEH